ncbi:MAG: CoA transferase [Acidimicrobiales bacterium]|nr:CoA transferase [Acidimicrobiales bacterium]
MGTLLDGLVIVDLSTVVSGPFAVRMLREQGARVIKVEAPGRGDIARYVGTSRNGVSAMYTTCNLGKEVCTIDVKSESGLAEILELIDGADMVVQNFRPGAMERIGLGWDTLHARNPALICVSISGFGTEGPMSGFRVYDPIIQAAAGICDTQVDPETGGPALFQGILADKVTSLYAAQAALGALLDRAQQRIESGTSVGKHIQVNMLDCGIHFNWPDGMYNHTFVETDKLAVKPDYSGFYRLSTAGDGHLAYSVVSDQEMTGAMRALGLGDLLDDPALADERSRRKARAELLVLIEDAVTAHDDLDQLLQKLWDHDVPASRVESRSTLHEHPQVVVNQSINDIDDPDVGRIRQSAPVFEI